MMERQYGRIVNIASMVGKTGVPFTSAYCATKAAVIGFTQVLGIWSALGYQEMMGIARVNLAETLLHLDQPNAAREQLVLADEIGQRLRAGRLVRAVEEIRARLMDVGS